MHVAPLTLADVPAYRELMLLAYAQAPDAFVATPEERAAAPDAWWARRIADPDGHGLAFGAFVDGRLVGSVAVEYSTRPKTLHRSLLIGMFVHPSARGLGAGRALVEAALAHARARPGAPGRTMVLTVTDGNEPALRLYRACGFEAFGTEPMAILAPGGHLAKVHMCCRLDAPRDRPAAAAPVDPVGPVQRQLEAYNDRDLARFVAEYADDVRVFRPPATEPVLSGKAAFAEHYARHRFNRAGLRAELVSRIASGRRVVDHERVHGVTDDGSVVEAIAVYDVDDAGLIRDVWFH